MDTANYLNDGNVDRLKYPLSVESLDFIQQQIRLVHELANMAGGNFIIQGCNVAGSQTTAGILIINGEILPILAGITQTKVRIREAVDTITAQYITYANARVRRWVEFGENADQVDTFIWADFLRIKTNAQLEAEKATHEEVSALQNLIMPTGAIVMWHGTIQTIPAGWALCDGENGTPNLLNRFIIGAGQAYPVGTIAGTTTKSLQPANIPSHSHDFQWTSYSSSADGVESTRIVRGQSNAENAVKSTEAFGQGQAFDIMPPYFALAYIMKL
jgi:hypothetical protein